MARTARVEIYDQSYNIRGELDEAYVGELARYVDAKMRSVGSAARGADPLRVAVLAALNIADELHALRAHQAELEVDLRQRAKRALTLVERALEHSG